MFPTDIINLIGYFAFGCSKIAYDLNDELNFMHANRGMIPDAFLEMSVPKLGFARRFALPFYMVKNPLRTDNPFYPWALIDPRVCFFSNTFIYWANKLKGETFRKLHTYPKIFRRHVRLCCMSGKQFGPNWNFFVDRYFMTDTLQHIESYQTKKAEGLFEHICYNLKNIGFISPGSYLTAVYKPVSPVYRLVVFPF